MKIFNRTIAKRRKRRIIIGIHGIGNKPTKRLLELWWEKAICEGLRRSGHPGRSIQFELVYWAHLLRSEPQSLKIKDQNSPLHIREPYTAAKGNATGRPSRLSVFLKKKSLDAIEAILDRLFLRKNPLFNFDRVSESIIRNKFQDLGLYYRSENVDMSEIGLHAKAVIQDELANTLKRHENKDILLIAHSMGSIVAYDVLTKAPGVQIDTLVTLGSPLGLPAIKMKILTALGKNPWKGQRVPTPNNILAAWYNFSDLKDGITLNYKLADDYMPNSNGVGPADIIVNNDFEYQGLANHHKSFGYLRTAEFGETIHQFMSAEEPSWLDSLRILPKRMFNTFKIRKNPGGDYGRKSKEIYEN